ncbi:hypothetical protein ABZ949_01980 [Micromonospora tulbaghiae]|uniref:hypothetical protein n=1 Tax=Micromonospora tulbaghiae TaxID=479978 RepID=UPI0033D133BB
MSTAVLSAPGEQNARQYGAITLTASLCVGGGVALNTFAGPTRIDALSGLRFGNRLDAADVYRAIRDAALADMHLPAIAEMVRQRLVASRAELDGRPNMQGRVADLDRALDVVEPLAFTVPAEPAPAPHARNFRELADLHRQGMRKTAVTR